MEAGQGDSRSDVPAGEEEPRLRYGPLIVESPRPTATGPASTRLAVSDKVLAVGDRDGQVHLLSHQGDQVRAIELRRGSIAPSTLQTPAATAAAATPAATAAPNCPSAIPQVRSFHEHSGEVTDLCFDDSAEHLASASSDGTVVVSACPALVPLAGAPCLPARRADPKGAHAACVAHSGWRAACCAHWRRSPLAAGPCPKVPAPLPRPDAPFCRCMGCTQKKCSASSWERPSRCAAPRPAPLRRLGRCSLSACQRGLLLAVPPDSHALLWLVLSRPPLAEPSYIRLPSISLH